MCPPEKRHGTAVSTVAAVAVVADGGVVVTFVAI